MRVNVYIRKKNEPLWESLEDKSDWVNRMLGENVFLREVEAEFPKEVAVYEKAEPGSGDAVATVTRVSTCKHGSAKGNCKHKECNV